jgi:hypothetical protein
MYPAPSSLTRGLDALLDVLTGEDPEFDRSAIARSRWVNADVLRVALDLAIRRIKALPPHWRALTLRSSSLREDLVRRDNRCYQGYPILSQLHFWHCL